MSRLDRIFYHPVTETALVLLTVAGLFGLVMLLLGALAGWRRLVALALVALSVLAVAASMIVEELVPMIGRDPPRRVAEVALGMAGILTSVGMLVAGAHLFVRNTLTAMATLRGAPHDNGSRPARPGSEGRPAHVPLSAWLRLWRRSGAIMLAALVLMFVSAAVYHESRFPFGGLLR